jgi:hypothetical protein
MRVLLNGDDISDFYFELKKGKPVLRVRKEWLSWES